MGKTGGVMACKAPSPSTLTGVLKASCRLFSSGQKCMDCPTRGTASCPLPDIEDLFMAPLPTRPPPPVHHRHFTTRARFKSTAMPVMVAPLQSHQPSSQRTMGTGFCSQQSNLLLRTRHSRMPSDTLKARTLGMASHNTSVGSMAAMGAAHLPVWLSLLRTRKDRDVLGGADRISAPDLSAVALGVLAEEALPVAEVQTTDLAAVVGQTASTALAADAVTDLTSQMGKELFITALVEGGCEGYFSLAQQAASSSDPKMAPLCILSTVLNALCHDPGTKWKGVWRWNSEQMLLCGGACGHTADILQRGMSLADFSSLARCKGVRVNQTIGTAGEGDEGLSRFRSKVADICSDEASKHIVVNFVHEKAGVRFSPIAGYHAKTDNVLLMDKTHADVSPGWVGVEDLWRAMCAQEGLGYVVISSWNDDLQQANEKLCPVVLRSWSEHGPKQDNCCKSSSSGSRIGKSVSHHHSHHAKRAKSRGTKNVHPLAPFAVLLHTLKVSDSHTSAGTVMSPSMHTKRAAR